MRPEVLYLQDIMQAAEAIGRFVAGIRRRESMRGELRQADVLHKPIVIGKAAAHRSREFSDRHPEID